MVIEIEKEGVLPLVKMGIILRMLTELFLHMNIRRKINFKMRKRNFDVMPYVFRMFKDRQTYYGHNFQNMDSHFKKGTTLQQFMYNGKPKKTARK